MAYTTESAYIPVSNVTMTTKRKVPTNATQPTVTSSTVVTTKKLETIKG